MQREFSVLAEGRHIFGRRPKPRELTETGNRLEKALAPSVHLRLLATFHTLIADAVIDRVGCCASSIVQVHKKGKKELQPWSKPTSETLHQIRREDALSLIHHMVSFIDFYFHFLVNFQT